MRFGKTILVSAIFAVVMAGASVAQAAPTAQLEESQGWVMLPVEKLSRGIANCAFGPLEILIRTWDVTQNQGGIAGITLGPLTGVVCTVARELAGVVEIVTFPFPLPNCPEEPYGAGAGYGPILPVSAFPEWVVDPAHDWGNFVYQETTVVPTGN